MVRALVCSSRGEHRASRTLVFFADITAVYPVFALGALYGQWLLSWWILGHQPRPSLDDPKYIVGASWMRGITGVALIGCLPMALVTAVLNTAYFCAHSNPGLRLSLRIVGIIGLWIGALSLIRSDPGLVGSWWLD